MKSHISKAFLVIMLMKGIFVVSLFLSLLLWSIPILSLNSNIWFLFQERSDTLLDSQDAKTYNDLILDFFKTGLGLDFLTQSEIAHMEEVRTIVRVVNVLFVFSFLSLISGYSYLSRSEKKFLTNAARKTSLIIFFMALALSIILVINFNAAFIAFHEIVFVKNFLFSSDSILKVLYPDKFFFNLAGFYLISVMLVSLGVYIFSRRLKLK